MTVKPASSITPGGLDHLRRRRAVPQHLDDGVERGIRRRMQIAIERRRLLADGEAPQHLAVVVPERRGDLREHDVAGRNAPRRMELRRRRHLRVAHRRRADEMDAGGAALARHSRARPRWRVRARSRPA